MPDPRLLPRRTLLGAGLGVASWLLAGCTTQGSGPASSRTTNAAAHASPSVAPLPLDVQAAVSLVASFIATGGLLSSAGRRRWGRRYRPLARVLTAQRDTLAGAVPPRAPRPHSDAIALPRHRAAAERLLADRVEALHAELVDAAVAAESGGFARLLASMAAGIDQQQSRLAR